MSLHRILPVVFLLSFGVLVSSAQAQDWDAEAWIHRGHDTPTVLHPAGDEDCFLEFPVDCLGGGGPHGGGHGGMMGPDSLLCRVETLDPATHPGTVVEGLHCELLDPDGISVMSDGCAREGVFRAEVVVRVHYDADRVHGMGLTAEQLCLATLTDSGWQRCEGAVHDRAAAAFTVSSSQPAATYAVVPVAQTVLTTETEAWGGLKSRYERN